MNVGHLTGQFSVRLTMNSLAYDHIPVPINTNQSYLFSNAKKKLDEISVRIAKRQKEKNQRVNSLFNFGMTPMYLAIRKPIIKLLKSNAKEPENTNLSYQELIHLTDNNIGELGISNSNIFLFKSKYYLM